MLNTFHSHIYYNNSTPGTNDVRKFADIKHSLKHNRRKETLTFDCREQYFPEGWAVRFNKHGEGMQVHFPVKVRWYITWSPLKYKNDNDTGNIISCKMASFENISVKVIEVAG